jgi:hypothetical protein
VKEQAKLYTVKRRNRGLATVWDIFDDVGWVGRVWIETWYQTVSLFLQQDDPDVYALREISGFQDWSDWVEDRRRLNCDANEAPHPMWEPPAW